MTCSRESRVSLRASFSVCFPFNKAMPRRQRLYFTLYTMLVQVVIKFLELLDAFVLIDLLHNGAKRGKRA